MKLKRVISIFERNSEKLIEEIDIGGIPLEILKEIFNPPDDDYLMYDPYSINAAYFQKLSSYFPIAHVFNEKNIYQLDCFANNE